MQASKSCSSTFRHLLTETMHACASVCLFVVTVEDQHTFKNKCVTFCVVLSFVARNFSGPFCSTCV